jgi:phosphonate transport system substrate-binding protein
MKFSETFKKIAGFGLAAVIALSMAACSAPAATTPSASDAQSASQTPAQSSSAPAASSETAAAGPITVVWYPNESAADYESARQEYANLITKATGRQVENKLTTDYSIAIEALANGTAQICFMGAQGYIEANKKSADVKPLFVNSGASGTLDDAIYYSWLSVNKGDEANYMKDSKYSIEGIEGKKISFVSNSSTSGFKVPTSNIIALFSKTDKWKSITADDLIEGGKDKFFSQVLFGGSHQGSAVNLLSKKADVAAFCDTELAPYSKVASGEENKTGAVYEIKADATAPFDTLKGKQFVIIQSTPVLNGPFAYNAKTLGADDAKKIQDLFTSDEVAANEKMFIPKGSKFVGMFKKSDKEHFVLVEDSWYNPIRELQQ